MSEPADVQELKTFCKKLERNKIEAERYCPPETGKRVLEKDLAYVSGHNNENESLDEETTKPREERHQLENRFWKNREVRQPSQVRRCYICNSKDHLKRFCPESRKSVGENSSNRITKPNGINQTVQNSKIQERKEIYCFRCGKKGYTVKTCPGCVTQKGNGRMNH